jgi:hypothetical protein
LSRAAVKWRAGSASEAKLFDFRRGYDGTPLANPLAMRALVVVASITACGVVPGLSLGPLVMDGGVAGDLAVVAVSPDLDAVPDAAIDPPDLTVVEVAADDLAVAVDLSRSRDLSMSRDLSTRHDLAHPPDLASADAYTPPSGDDSPVAHAAPSAMSGVTTLLPGHDILDVSTDQGGGVWAVGSGRVYYLAPGGNVYNYDQGSGLARGWWTWTDTYYGYGTAPVTFASVAGGVAGEAVIGNVGAIADRMQVNPATGAVTRIDNMKVVVDATDPVVREEQQNQLLREVAMIRAIADLNGTFNGTAYLGGFHGFSAFHSLAGDCSCTEFEQHLHAFVLWTPDEIASADVRGLALSPAGDVWEGDRDAVVLWPQRSLGPRADFFQDPTAAVDVFPGVRDEVWGVGVDSSNGVYVASHGNGLAYLSPASHQPSAYWSRGTTLPQNHLSDVTVDASGEVWLTTDSAGVARFNPATNSWRYYTAATGLASNGVHRVYVDKYASTRVLYFATGNGITVFRP